MHILLPPSETKRSGGVGVLVPARLAGDAVLGDARVLIRSALEALSADEAAAASALKLGVKSRGEIAHNLVLGSSGAMPAVERYTGVLYDALGAGSLDPAARAWIDAHVSIQSALFGLLSAGDLIPAYRLSAGSRLTAGGTPMKRLWREAHAAFDWTALGWVLDLRSKDYAELAPRPRGIGASLEVMQLTAGGETRALNHFNKAAKGDLVRRLAESEAVIDDMAALVEWGEAHGIQLQPGPDPESVTLITEVGVPGAGPAQVRLSGPAATAR